MLTFPSSVRIFMALQPVDMRKSHHALAAVVRERLDLDPLSGHLVIFVNKRRTLAKVLFFDRTGLALLFKRLERGTFEVPQAPPEQTKLELDPAKLAMILEGIDLKSAKRRLRYSRPPPSPDHR